jgi:replicative DNA helicase
LADVIRKYRIFVECIKKEEQKELSSAKKNLIHRIFSRSNIHYIAKAVNTTSMKRVMMTNGTYMKMAGCSNYYKSK